MAFGALAQVWIGVNAQHTLLAQTSAAVMENDMRYETLATRDGSRFQAPAPAA